MTEEPQPKHVLPKELSGLSQDLQLSPQQVYRPAPDAYDLTVSIVGLINGHIYELRRHHEIYAIHVPNGLVPFLAHEGSEPEAWKTWNGIPVVPIEGNRLYVSCSRMFEGNEVRAATLGERFEDPTLPPAAGSVVWYDDPTGTYRSGTVNATRTAVENETFSAALSYCPKQKRWVVNDFVKHDPGKPIPLAPMAPDTVRCKKCDKTPSESRQKYCGDGRDKDNPHDYVKIETAGPT